MTRATCSVDVNQSRFWQTNTGIISDPDGNVVLIDPGVLPDELEALARNIGEGSVIGALATHEDWDHVLWSHSLGTDVPRYAHPDTVRILREQRDTLIASLVDAEQELGTHWDHNLVGTLDPVPDATVAFGEHIRITVIPTPGHTAGHTSLWLEGEGVIFAGDMLSDIDPPILADAPGSTEQFHSSLHTLRLLVHRSRTVMPGHGTACDHDKALQRLEMDRRYLDVTHAVALLADDHPDVDALARETADALNDPRIRWDEGWRAHVMNIETMLRYR